MGHTKSKWRQDVGKIGGLTRVCAPDDPKLIDARRELKNTKATEYIRRLVDEAPPLTADQRAKLAELLAPVRRTAGA